MATSILRLGDAVQPVLERHVAAGEGRFRGVRTRAAWHADPALHAAADAVTNWPTGDLFPNYGLPSRYQHRVYLPLTLR